MNKTIEEILKSGESLETWVLDDNGLNRRKDTDRGAKGWYIDEKALMYYNTGYEATYTIPDWDKLAANIRERYDWPETLDDLYEAFSDAVSVYRLRSRG